MLHRRSLYWVVTGVYAVVIGAYYGLGARFGVSYQWQHFHDVDLLEERLWESLLYTHAFTPLINLFVGAVLKLSERHAESIYLVVYVLLGGVLANAMAYLMAVLGLGRKTIVLAVTLFVLSPPFLYLGSFLHYELPTAALLAAAGVLLHRALSTGRFGWWLGFFSLCALIALLRTSFHLVWMLALVVLALLSRRRHWRRVLGAALAPLVLVGAVYAKNLYFFGFFGASSWFGFNLAIVTTQQLSKTERRRWVERGELHPVSAVALYAAPHKYAPHIAYDFERPTGIAVLDRQLRTNGQPNYNHLSYIAVSRLRMMDNLHYLRRRPGSYLDTVRRGIIDYFRPTSRWHPKHPDGSPHRQNRQLLLPWERFYNRIVHGFGFHVLAPFGLYVVVLGALGYRVAGALRSTWQQRSAAPAADQLVLFMAFCSLYVPLLSCLVTIGELERYRFVVEAFMWVLALSGLNQLHHVRRAHRALTPE